MTFMCACGYVDTCNNPALATKIRDPRIKRNVNLLDIINQSVPRCKHFPARL